MKKEGTLGVNHRKDDWRVWKELALALYEDGVTNVVIDDPWETLKEVAPERWDRLQLNVKWED